MKQCDKCKRKWHDRMVRKCPHPKAEGKGITYICMYCCKGCKFYKKDGTGVICNYALY